jgi:hypothetical protein
MHMREGKLLQILRTKTRGKGPYARNKSGQKNHISMDFKEIKCETVDWINLAQNRCHS